MFSSNIPPLLLALATNISGKKTTKRAHFESPLVQDTPEFSTPKRGKQDSVPILQPQFVKLEDENTLRRTSRVSNGRPELGTPGKGQENAPDTPRRTSRVSNRRPELDTAGKGQENTLDTPKHSSRVSNKGVLLDTSGQAEEDALGTPRRTSRVSKKRVLFDSPEQPASARVSKRRKTPTIKMRGGARRLDGEDNFEDFSR